MINEWFGKRASEATQQKMCEAHKRRGTRSPAAGDPWTPEEHRLVRTLPAAEAVKRKGRTLQAVYNAS